MNLFNINTTFFTLAGYPMSYIEFFGTISGLISVWFATKANIHTWTTGIINIILFFAVYYQVQLYSDMFLQVFFMIVTFLGLWQWIKKSKKSNDKNITLLTNKLRIITGIAIVIATGILGGFMADIHIFFPNYFLKPAAFPYADALTSVLSIVATFLMAYKKVECWILWIIVDIICVFLYFRKEIIFISFEYLIFFGMALFGLLQWIKTFQYDKRTFVR